MKNQDSKDKQEASNALSDSPCSPLEREEFEEACALVLECARKHGELDAKEGVTIPPAEFCEDTKVSKMLRDAWLQGWYSANDQAQRPPGKRALSANER